MSESVLEVAGVSYRYDGPTVLSECSFAMASGEFCALAGPNGAGKSTLLSLITGQRKPAGGSLKILGKNHHQWNRKELAKHLALVPQNDSMPGAMTVSQAVLLGRTPHLSGLLRFESKNDKEIVRKLLERIGISEFEHREVGTLSGGERRLVTIARALAQEPKILLLDEPASSLDLHRQQEIFRLLKSLKEKDGLTILVISHDLNLAANYCDRLFLLHGGKIAASGIPNELLNEKILEPIYGAELWTTESPAGARFVGLKP